MSASSHATCYADLAVQCQVTIQQNVPVAPGVYRLRFACSEIARRAVPGQFVMLRLAHFTDPLIGRPLAIYDIGRSAAGAPESLELIYLVKGNLTSRLATMTPGQRLDVWGPLGNGFPAATGASLVMVAGGIGQTPFLTLAKEALGQQTFGDPPRKTREVPEIALCHGAQTAEALIAVQDFRQLGIDVHLATDDGTEGHHGLVSEVLEQVLDRAAGPIEIVCCGSSPMMKAVARIAQHRGLSCQVSLETPMACGIGICFTCVAKVKDATGQWDYKRTCVEGPVFDAHSIEWD